MQDMNLRTSCVCVGVVWLGLEALYAMLSLRRVTRTHTQHAVNACGCFRMRVVTTRIVLASRAVAADVWVWICLPDC